MATTVNGGAYKRGDTWVNANGEPLEKAQIAEAEKLSAEREQQLAQDERALVELTASRDPVARALLQQQVQTAAARASRSEK